MHFIDAIELKKWGDRHIETGRNEKTQRRKEGGERAGRVSDKGPQTLNSHVAEGPGVCRMGGGTGEPVSRGPTLYGGGEQP